MNLERQDQKVNAGLLLMRLGLTAVLLIHSVPKLSAGVNTWHSIGTTLSFINIGVPPKILGFAMLILESLGAVSFVCGSFFRIACTVLFVLFSLYAYTYYRINYQTLMLWSIGLASVFLGLLYVGPGRYAIAVKVEKK